MWLSYKVREKHRKARTKKIQGSLPTPGIQQNTTTLATHTYLDQNTD